MKVTINIDCTPLEARQFMGLPDVQPMQAAVMAEMEKRVMAEAAKFSPEGFCAPGLPRGSRAPTCSATCSAAFRPGRRRDGGEPRNGLTPAPES